MRRGWSNRSSVRRTCVWPTWSRGMNNVFRAASIAGVVLMLAGTASFGPAYPEVHQAAPAQAQPSRDDAGPPELPRVVVDVPAIAVTGRTIHVPAGGNLQKAIDDAKPGDAITLAPGATYRGTFQLRRKEGDGWIVIGSAAKDLPAAGTRVNPSDAPKMAKIVADSGYSVFRTEAGAHHYRLVGLEIAPAEGKSLTNLIELGGDERALEALPHHVIIDRCYLHGDKKEGTRRGVSLNASHVAVIDSYFSDFKERTADAQAVSGWNGPGPFLIEGNYLEASGENIMFGGGDPAIPNLVPSDIVVTRNHLSKPLRWKKDDPSFEGTEWAVKNLFELKNARRVLVDGNLLEYNWPHAQNGFAILFTVRNQDGGAPWSVIEDVTFVNNIVRHVAGGINMLGRDDIQQSQQTSRISISNNLFVDVGGDWGNGRLFQLLDGTHGVSIDHNTALQTGSLLFGGDHAPHTGFVFQNNIAPHNEHGISGSGTSPGTQTLARYFPRAIVRGNVIIGGSDGQYPTGNTFARTAEDAGIAALRTGDVAAMAARPPRAGAGGPVAGADLIELLQAIDGVAPQVRDDRAPATAAAALVVPSGSSHGGGGASAVLWTALALLAYVYVGYPLVAAARARIFRRPTQRAAIAPSVSIVVGAYNEADRIEERIENLLALDYPAPGLLEI